ncbi:chemotaxis protein CheD [Chengkuizengella axinellae]|uniref:Probable chemoreceptor glutamine deamidase CheD n=1 Tax=Chengkuizengella axinellae TaxID=3064388 RepID=A0ABT9IXC9_9BACL|nr:chemotaxis protein CheD [Chengkuizengella sp. 2205SS18-9]MDP5273464.1 chemotaxis protein CheD [Chengkuizengella sp. 2205SS18-9]
MIESTILRVGIAELNVLRGEGIIKTTGLGSCIGMTLYDPINQVGGLAHIMLPASRIARDANFNKAKYADTAIPELLDQMLSLGASRKNIHAKMAGGAQMFQIELDSMKIGYKNIVKCKEILKELNIPIRSEDTGGGVGRTIELNILNGSLSVRSIKYGIKEI